MTKEELESMSFDYHEVNTLLAVNNNVLLNTVLDLLIEVKAKLDNKERSQVEDEVEEMLSVSRRLTSDLLKKSASAKTAPDTDAE